MTNETNTDDEKKIEAEEHFKKALTKHLVQAFKNQREKIENSDK